MRTARDTTADLRFSLDLFLDRSAIAAHQTIIQTSRPLGYHALLKPAVSMQCSITSLPKPAELTFGFSSNRKMIDNFHGPAIFLGPENNVL